MSKWIDFTIDERKAMIQAVSDEKQIDEASAEKDWWVTAVLYVIFHTSIGEYLLFKGGTSLSKGWNIINRFSEDIDLALSRDFFLNVKNLACVNCTSNTQIHHLREKAQDYILGDFKSELKEELKRLGLPVTVIGDNDVLDENGEPLKVPHDKDPSVIFVKYPSLYQSNAAYATPTVKIEISVLSMEEPFEMRRISSLVEQAFDGEDVDSDLVQTIRTVTPARTFTRKGISSLRGISESRATYPSDDTSFLRFGKADADSIRRSGSQRCGIIRRHRQPQTQILSCRVCGL